MHANEHKHTNAIKGYTDHQYIGSIIKALRSQQIPVFHGVPYIYTCSVYLSALFRWPAVFNIGTRASHITVYLC